MSNSASHRPSNAEPTRVFAYLRDQKLVQLGYIDQMILRPWPKSKMAELARALASKK